MSVGISRIIFPRALNRGDTVGLVTPSSPAAGVFVQRFTRGVCEIEEMGFNVRLAKHCTTVHGDVAASAVDRAADLHDLFSDGSVKAIIATLGGGRANEVLQYLDWELIRANPKIVCGYSDTTVLLQAIQKFGGFVAYYGPSLMTEFAEFPGMPDYSREMFLRAVGGSQALDITPLEQLAVERIDWSSPDESRRQRKFGAVAGGVVVRSGTVTGPIAGGCIEALEKLRGTPYWPDLDGRILVLETAKEQLDLRTLADTFTDYANMGVWRQVAGVAFGQKNWSHPELNSLASLIGEFTSSSQAPAMIGLPIGHITPIATIPMGANGRLEADRLRLVAEGGNRD